MIQRFHLDIRTNTVTDSQTGEVHTFATREAAWFGRGKLEVAHRPAAVVSERKAKRLEAIQERKEAGR